MTARVPVWAVVPAAGMGRRMQAAVPKQYQTLLGKTLLEVTLERFFDPTIFAGVVVALAPGDTYWANLPLSRAEGVFAVEGGCSRSESVGRAVAWIRDHLVPAGSADAAWVCVHDAARPCVSHEKITQLVNHCLRQNVGALLGTPVSDTVKRCATLADTSEAKLVQGTEDRRPLWLAHTPQMFRLSQLQKALAYCAQMGIEATDEASAVEAMGESVHLVPDYKDNIKVTLAEDLAMAEFILNHHGEKALCE